MFDEKTKDLDDPGMFALNKFVESFKIKFNMKNNKLAIFLIIVSVFFGTLMLTFLKLAQEEVNVYTAGFLDFY